MPAPDGELRRVAPPDRGLASATPRDAAALHVRPLTPGDRDRLAEGFAALSPRTRYLRFLTPKRELTATELTYLTEIDHRTHEALAAVDPVDGRLVGVARYVSLPDAPGTADFAFVVADAWQGLGVGARLGRELVRRAAENGIARLTATTLDENRAARAALRRLGFRTRAIGGGLVDLALDLEPARG